jgi:hypothetical protein
MSPDPQRAREADLLMARQFGQLYCRELNSLQVRIDFEKVFKDDPEAVQQFEAGAIEEDQRRLTLRMSPEQYRTYHTERRSTHGRVQPRQPAKANR